MKIKINDDGFMEYEEQVTKIFEDREKLNY